MPLLSATIFLLIRACINDSETLEKAFGQIIRSVEGGMLTTLSDHNSQSWMGKSKRYLKEWRRVMRLFTPLSACNVETYINVMEKNFILKAETNEIESKNLNNSIELNSKSNCSDKSITILKLVSRFGFF